MFLTMIKLNSYFLSFLFSLCISVSYTVAQTLPYKKIVSAGQLPSNFGHTFYDDYLLRKRQINIDMPRKERLIQDQFYIESYAGLYGIQFSGKVMFGTLLNEYVNRVADSLLVGNPELRKKIQIYVLRSSALNAFATDAGVIYINVGLLARIENEAQLAYIIAHEIVHFQNRHVISGYVFRESSHDDYRKTREEYEEFIITSHNYSQSLEYEADSIGYDLFAKSNYQLKSAASTFDLLESAEGPVFDHDFGPDYFNVNGILPKIDTITSDKGERTLKITVFASGSISDSLKKKLSTHPETKERKKKIETALTKTKSKEGKQFLRSKEEFDKMRTAARCEHLNVLLSEGLYAEALTTSVGMQKEYPSELFPKQMEIKALQALSVSIRSSKYEVEKRSASIREVSHMFLGMEKAEIGTFVLLRSVRDYDAMKDISGYTEDLDNYSSFCFKNLHLKDIKRQDTVTTLDYFSTTCKELLKMPHFKKIEEREYSETSGVDISKEKLIVYKSINFVVDVRNEKQPVDLIQSEQTGYMLDNKISKGKVAGRAAMHSLSPYVNMEKDVESYNDFVTITEVVSDVFSFESDFSTVNEHEIDNIIKKYGTRYVFIPATYTLVQRGPTPLGLVLRLQFVPFVLPWALKKSFVGNRYSYFEGIVIDLKTKKIIRKESFEIKQKPPLKASQMGIKMFMNQ